MAEYLPLSRLREILGGTRRLRAGVIGDFTLQGVWTADMTRARQADGTLPLARPVVSERYTCSGGAAVALNLAALGLTDVHAFTMLGDDWRGGLLRRALCAAGVDDQDALSDPAWSTPFFGRVRLASGDKQVEDARLDFVNTAGLSVESEEMLLARVEARLPELDALIITDYQTRGVVTPAVLDGLNHLASATDRVVFTVDSREHIGSFTDMIRIPDAVEAARWLFPERAPDRVGLADFIEAALYPQVDCGCPLFISLGADGCLVMVGGESHRVHPLTAPLPVDLREGGAFLAVLTAALAAGALPEEAAHIGQLAAAVALRDPDAPILVSPDAILAADNT